MIEVKGFIVILDISGYTRFVRSHNMKKVPFYGDRLLRMSEAHAEQVVTDLLETLVGKIGSGLRVEKLEGDAILMSAISEEDTKGAKALEISRQLEEIFPCFHARIHKLVFCRTCLCDCCAQMGQLRVKAIAHHGSFLIKTVLGLRELAGQELIRAHRLLKNQVNTDEYLLLTDEFVNLGRVRDELEMTSHTEVDPELGDTKVWVHRPKDYSIFEQEDPESYIKRLRKMRSYFASQKDRSALIESVGGEELVANNAS